MKVSHSEGEKLQENQPLYVRGGYRQGEKVVQPDNVLPFEYHVPPEIISIYREMAFVLRIGERSEVYLFSLEESGLRYNS